MWNWLLCAAHAEESVEEAIPAIAEEAAPSWFETAFGKFSEFPVWGWVLVAVLLVGGLLAWYMVKGKERTVWSTRMVALGAMCIALSYVLGMIRLWRMPNGGSITPAATLPLMLFAYVYGVGPGLLVGTLYGLLDYLAGGYFLSVPQVLLDYIVAYTVMGLAGILRKHPNQQLGLLVGVVIASVARWICAVAAGVLFWAESTPEGMSALIYSMGYNGSYMAVNCVICIIVAALIGPRLVRELRKIK